jgi:TRAP-type C4-dicarboxylate transport system permease small subunit
MQALSQLTRFLELVLLWLLAVLFGVLCLTVFYQVLVRNMFGGGGLWTFDIAQLSLTWCVFLGAAVAVRRGMHYYVEILPGSFVKTNRVMKLCSDLAIMIVAVVLLFYGFDFLDTGSATDQDTLPFSMYWNYLPLPASGGFMLVFLIEIWIADLAALRSSAQPA